jgi:hypothetical protein
MRPDRVEALAHGLRNAGTSTLRRGDRHMQALRTHAARYALVVVLSAVALAGLAWAGASYIESRQVPESVMGPGYNPAPPVIPVS